MKRFLHGMEQAAGPAFGFVMAAAGAGGCLILPRRLLARAGWGWGPLDLLHVCP